jgi:excisionase family DNA binding protein
MSDRRIRDGLLAQPKFTSCGDGPTLMTIREVAAELRCSERHVCDLRRQGYLKTFCHGKKMLRFHRSSLHRYIESLSMGGV